MPKFEQLYLERIGIQPQDLLTGLYNHAFFHSKLKQMSTDYKKEDQPLSLVLLDIDLFSGINKRIGYMDGDRILKKVGELIKDQVRDEDVASRYREDLFAILLPGIGTATAEHIAERIRSAAMKNKDDQITVSIGISDLNLGGMDPDLLLQSAFYALEQAKIRGKNRIHTYRSKEASHTREGARILIVDDDKINAKLLDAMLNPLGYETVLAEDGEGALKLINKIEFDLILLDIMMPGMDGYEVCRKLKENEETRRVPVILITALDDIDARVKGIQAGADDFLTKPANREELLARTQSLVKVRKLNKNYTSIENVLISMANAVEAKDSYTQGHTERVSRLAENLGARMGLTEEDLEALRLGGILHDVGKIGVPEVVLNKPGPLAEEEWTQMKSHTELGYSICLPLTKTLGKALDIIRHHHEKLDGSSYPDNLSGDEISMGARIMSVVDIYDALITDRPYRKAMTTEKAFEILAKEAKEGKLDNKVVDNLIELLQAKPEKKRRESDKKDVSMKTILVVEDDPLNLKLIKTLLEIENYRIKSESTAENILELVKAHSPDLIIMDIQLPGIDGLEATRMVKNEPDLASIPIIAVSAHAMQKDIDEAEEAGCNGYVTKPLNTRTFAQAITEYMS